jgi:uncharacterized protein YdeI (YjbR/CyaY-like superfamily)
MAEPDAVFFKSAAEFRKWLAKNHAKVPVLWIAFWKAASGRKGLTYNEAVEESLCYGWIDGLKHKRDADSYQLRFTPRKPRSIWSAINLKKMEALAKAGRLAKPGIAVFEARDPSRAGLYSTENRHVVLSPEFEKRFRSKKAAWKFFEAQPPGYRRIMAFWVMSAKQEVTRERRLARLIEDSARNVRLA